MPTWKTLLEITAPEEFDKEEEDNVPISQRNHEDMADVILKTVKRKIHTGLNFRLDKTDTNHTILMLASSLYLRRRETNFTFKTVIVQGIYVF